MTKALYCCGCSCDVVPRSTNGEEVYPHRSDLGRVKFWKCDACGNHVGCHRGKGGSKPLGCIPTEEIRLYRRRIHEIIDPVWMSGRLRRKDIYKKISQELGREYHTAEIKTIEEAKQVYALVKSMFAR